MTNHEPTSDDLQAELDRIAAAGDQLASESRYLEAIAVYRQGFDLIPHPKIGNAASLWFMAAIGDAQWYGEFDEEGKDTWRDVILLYGGFGNPFVHLRRGQTLLHLGDRTEAANELLRALLLGGQAIFSREPDEYWDFITSEVRPPPDYPNWIGWPGLEKDSEEYRRWTDPTGVYQFTKKEPQ